MSGVRDLLIRGSKKVTGHYRLLLAGTRNEEDRERYPALSESESCVTTCNEPLILLLNF